MEMILNQRKHFHIKRLTLPMKLVDWFFDFVLVFEVFFVAIYTKSANSCPIKLPIATPMPPMRTPQNTLLDKGFTIGFL